MEICLEGLLDDYDEVRGAVAGHEDSEACRLLEKAYCEMLLQIQGWLDEIVECLDDPTDALEERGLTSEEDQRQPIRLNLNLEAPPSFTTLTRWIEQKASTLRIKEESSRQSRTGFGWWDLLAACGLGWWLGNPGDDGDCDC